MNPILECADRLTIRVNGMAYKWNVDVPLEIDVCSSSLHVQVTEYDCLDRTFWFATCRPHHQQPAKSRCF